MLCDDKFTPKTSRAPNVRVDVWLIVMTATGLSSDVAGNTRDVIHRFTVDLPKKHSHGGSLHFVFSACRQKAA